MKRGYFVSYLYDLGSGVHKPYDGYFEIEPPGTDFEAWKKTLREHIKSSEVFSMNERALADTPNIRMVLVNFFELH